jgi:hypothetical protein
MRRFPRNGQSVSINGGYAPSGGGGGVLHRTVTRHGWRVVSAHGWLERVRRNTPPPPPQFQHRIAKRPPSLQFSSTTHRSSLDPIRLI